MPEIHLSRTLLLHGTRPAAGHFLSGYITCMKFHVDVPKLLLPVDVCLIHFRQSRSTAITVGFHISQRLRNDLLPLFFCGILNQISCHFLFLSCISFTANVSQQSAGCKFFSAFRVIENLRPKNSLIDLQILILKHIKDHIFDTAVRSLLQILLYRLYGNLRRLVVRKAEYPSGYTAERHTFQPVCRCQFQTGQVTGPKQCAMFLRQFSLHNRTYGMQDITAGQIAGFRDLRLSGGFLMPLFSHFASPMLVSALFTLSCIEIIISPIAGIRKAGTIKCPGYPKDTIGTNI